MNFEKLFTSFKIGDMELPNRIVLSPMGTNSANSDGTISSEEIDYFTERAKGGAGMLIMGCQFISEEMAQGSQEGLLENSYVIPKLTSLIENVHRYGSKIVAQVSCGTGKNAFASMYDDPPVSASPIPSTFNSDIKCKPLTKEDIDNIMQQFANAADIVKKAGFDAIEIHGHAGYLIDQFMSDVWNNRDDEYGGNVENRMRFPIEIVKSVREVIGEDMPILFRIALDHRFDGGRDLEESMKLIKILEEEGVDALDIDAGAYESIEYIFPPAYLGDACMDYVCEPAREVVDIPLLNSGNHTPETALNLVEFGKADLAMFGRPLIADPYLPKKLKNNNREDIRPCIRCNQDCIGRIMERTTKLSCSVNPKVCEEKRFQIKKTSSAKDIAIIGAGPAGLEAARTASLKGHNVTVYEKEKEIGGQLAAAATPEFKSQLKDLIDWYNLQMNKLDIDLKLATKISVGDNKLSNYDEIIVATGAESVNPSIPGIDNKNVINVIEAHKNKEKIEGDKVVICGGGLSGCDSALELAIEEDKDVTIIEMLDEIAEDEMMINKTALLKKLNEAGVKIKTNNKVINFEENGVKIENEDGLVETIKADTIVTAFGMKPDNELGKALKDKYPLKTNIIGDCKEVAKVGEAIRSGFYAATSID